MARKYTEARARANKKYDAKTYKKYTFYLRVEEDAKVIDSLESAKASGQSARQWLNDLYERK